MNYEPGSTVKVFMAGILLAEQAVSPGERFFCDGEIKFHNSTVRCRVNGRVHKHGNLNLSQIIARSCNVGIIKAMQRVRRDRFYDYMQRLGFGQKTEVLPPGSGETSGYFPDLDRWVPSTSYYMPIGQGFSVTPIQLMRAGASLANGGRLVQPYIARQILDREGAILHTAEPAFLENPFSAAVNREVLRLMQGVVDGGTGTGARVQGLTIAGKTGTGEKSSARGYLDKYVASFMGFFPVENPRYGRSRPVRRTARCERRFDCGTGLRSHRRGDPAPVGRPKRGRQLRTPGPAAGASAARESGPALRFSRTGRARRAEHRVGLLSRTRRIKRQRLCIRTGAGTGNQCREG